MAVIRVEKNRNFTTMSNYHLRDLQLSLKAKGLLSICLSLPDNWDYSVNGLTAICREGRDAILTTLQELERFGYVYREQTRCADGRMGKAAYVIYESPGDNPQWERPQTENPTTVKPTADHPTAGEPITENPTQLSTDELKTERIKDREKKEVRHQYGQYRNVLLTDQDFQKLREEFPADYEQRIERLSEYMASTGKSYRSHLATIRSWARRSTEKRQAYSHTDYSFKEGESL